MHWPGQSQYNKETEQNFVRRLSYKDAHLTMFAAGQKSQTAQGGVEATSSSNLHAFLRTLLYLVFSLVALVA